MQESRWKQHGRAHNYSSVDMFTIICFWRAFDASNPLESSVKRQFTNYV